MKIYLISDNVDTVTGMRLAGVEGEVVHKKDELSEAIARVLKDKSVGILFITELLSNTYPDVIADVKLSTRCPLFWKFRIDMEAENVLTSLHHI